MLADLAHVYERLGPFRAVVRVTSGPETRRRFRFVADESMLLQRLMERTAAEMRGDLAEVPLTPRALIALWGRVLTGLQKKRRGPDTETLARRALLDDKLSAAARALGARDPEALEREIRTRRLPEVEWMRERLGG